MQCAHLLFLLLSSIIGNILATTTTSDGCITGIDLYAGTGDVDNAGSKSVFQYQFTYEIDGNSSTYSMQLSCNDQECEQGQGYLWISNGPEECVTIADIDDMSYIEPFSGGDGWYIKTAIVYGELDNNVQDLVLISHGYMVNSLVDANHDVELPTNNIERDNCAAANKCIKFIYIMINTGCHDADGTSGRPHFQLDSYDFELVPPNPGGGGLQECNADFFGISALGLGIVGCLKFGSVKRIAFHLKDDTADGWRVTDAMVTVRLNSGDYALLAGERNIPEPLVNEQTVNLTMTNKCI